MSWYFNINTTLRRRLQPCEATRVNLLNVNFQLNSINYIKMEQFKLANPSPSIVCSQGMQSWANSNWALSLSPRPLVCLSGPALPVWQSKQRAKFGLNVLIWTTLSTNSLCVLFFPLQFSLPRHFSLDVFVLRAWHMGGGGKKEKKPHKCRLAGFGFLRFEQCDKPAAYQYNYRTTHTQLFTIVRPLLRH